MAYTADSHPRERHAIRMLVAEDSQSDLLLLREAFQRCVPHVAIHPVSDGVALLKRLADEEPKPAPFQAQLLLMDANLPRLDARALMGSLRALACAPHVVVLATDELQGDRLACLASLEARVVVRPIYYGQWLSLVESLMPMLVARLADNRVRPSMPLPRADDARV